MIEKEIELLSQLEHDNIVKIIGAIGDPNAKDINDEKMGTSTRYFSVLGRTGRWGGRSKGRLFSVLQRAPPGPWGGGVGSLRTLQGGGVVQHCLSE